GNITMKHSSPITHVILSIVLLGTLWIHADSPDDQRQARRLRAEAAYQEMKGNLPAAIEAYRKSLEFLPDAGIEEKLRLLEAGPTGTPLIETPDESPKAMITPDPNGFYFAFEQAFSLNLPDGETLKDPHTLLTDSSGQFLVLETHKDTAGIYHFDSTGHFIRRLGAAEDGIDRFDYPKSMFIDGTDQVTVVNSYGSSLIHVFDIQGNLIRSFGVPGKEDHQINNPFGIAPAPNGGVFLVDGPYSSKVRVSRWDASGNYVSSFGSSGKKEGQFREPRGLAVDSKGYLYVSDRGNSRIQKFSPDGGFVTTWGKYGRGTGMISGEKLALSPMDEVLFIDSGNSRLQLFDSDGKFLSKWGCKGPGNGSFSFLRSACFSKDGLRVFTLDNTNRVQVFVRTSTPPPPTPAALAEIRRLGGLSGVKNFSVLADDSILLCNPSDGKIRIIRTDVTESASSTPDVGALSFAKPTAALFDGSGQLWVVESAYENCRIRIISSELQELLAFGEFGDATHQFKEPVDAHLDPQGNLVVCDVMKSCALRFNPKGEFMGVIGQRDPGATSDFTPASNALLSYPEGIGIDSDGRIAFADKNNHSVQVFSAEGAFLFRVAPDRDTVASLSFPHDVAFDPNGRIFVADNGNDRIQVFSPEGDYILTLGQTGNEPGELSGPVKLAFGGRNILHVLDETGTLILFDLSQINLP
ncbi:MAG: hypothetical protein PHF70_04330, partial [Opitutales bacterium]|nr:hypothetical protein [Opitutales bacterium]